jgi:hypothetical protein
MRDLTLTLNDAAFRLVWRALHDREEELLRIAEHGDSDSDEAALASNDLVYLRMWRKNLEEKARAVFRDEAFTTSDETIDLSEME